MVFEPAFIKINAGDSINFEMSDAGHNAVTVAAPAGSVPFDTKYKPSDNSSVRVLMACICTNVLLMQ